VSAAPISALALPTSAASAPVTRRRDAGASGYLSIHFLLMAAIPSDRSPTASHHGAPGLLNTR